jgi:phage integrase family
MATYKIRGNSHSIIFPYKTEMGKTRQQWETYATELEALQRKVFIEYLQKRKDHAGLRKAVNEYKDKRAREKAEIEAHNQFDKEEFSSLKSSSTDNLYKTYREFALKWLPLHARRKRFSPGTYDDYRASLELHIFPYFGDRIMSSITTADIDDWLDQMCKKPCQGSRSYNKAKNEIPTLSSSSIKKHYNVFIAGLPFAKDWGYIKDIPNSHPPAEKQKKRKAWDSKTMLSVLNRIDDKLLHLVVHIAFVCSMRIGEIAGIDIKAINFHNRSFWIRQSVLRVTEKALKTLPENEIIRIFPKELKTSSSRLILKAPKTEGSVRQQYLTTPLLWEIKERLDEIEEYKRLFGVDYKDYGLLICKPDGKPIDPHSFVKKFKNCQREIGLEEEDIIEIQGLRKSGQMHKVRLSQNNYQLVAEASGQSPEVLMSNYNEALEDEKKTLTMLVETNFYGETQKRGGNDSTLNAAAIQELLKTLPELPKQILQLLQSNVQHV